MPYDATRSLEQYVPLLRGLHDLAEDTARRLRELREPMVPDRILLAFLGKSIDSLRAVIILQESGLRHEAQSLARGLFELRLSCDAFVEMMRKDVRAACTRVMDAVMLEKIKQARSSEFKGFDLLDGTPTRASMRKLEVEIAARYSEPEFEKLKKYGFTGLNIEQRAKQSHLSAEYNIVYRNFSRNVHSTDFMELLLQEDPNLIGRDHNVYLEQRDRVCCELTFISVAGIVSRVNALAGLKLEDSIESLSRRLNEVRQTKYKQPW